MQKEVNLSIDISDYERLKEIAKTKKTTVKNYIKNVFKKSFPNENETCVVLRFPKDVLTNEEIFNKWLNQTTQSLKGLFKKDLH